MMEQISDLTLLVFRTSFGRTHMWCLSGGSQFNLATCTAAASVEESRRRSLGFRQSTREISWKRDGRGDSFVQLFTIAKEQTISLSLCTIVGVFSVLGVVIWIFAIFSELVRAAERFLQFV